MRIANGALTHLANGPTTGPVNDRIIRGRLVKRLVTCSLPIVLFLAFSAASPAIARVAPSIAGDQGLVTWVENFGGCFRILGQNVGGPGPPGDPFLIQDTPCIPNGGTSIAQFHASPDGRVLAYFTITGAFGRLTGVSLGVLTLDANGRVLTESVRELPVQISIKSGQDQIQVSDPPRSPMNASVPLLARLVAYIEDDGCGFRVMGQRVGSGGFLEGPFVIHDAPCLEGGTAISQFHSSSDGRTLAFFVKTSPALSPVPTVRLVVIALDENGRVRTTSERTISPRAFTPDGIDLIQVSDRSGRRR